MQSYYSPWEWQPIKYMPDGCNDVTVEFADGLRKDMCSCDYHWSIYKKSSGYSLPLKFRYK